MKRILITPVALMGLMTTPASAQSVAQVATGIEDPDEAYDVFNYCLNLDYEMRGDEAIIETMEVRGFIQEAPCARVIFYMSANFRAEAYRSYGPDTIEAMRLWHEFIEADPDLRNRVDRFGDMVESPASDGEPYIGRLRWLHREAMEREEEYNPHQFAGVTHAPQRGFCFAHRRSMAVVMWHDEDACRAEGLDWWRGTYDERETHLGH